MNRIVLVALAATGFAALGGRAGAAEMHLPASLTAFGAATPILSASALPVEVLEGSSRRVSLLSDPPMIVHASFAGITPPRNFAASVALSANLAVDAGYNVDLSRRFDNYGGLQSPLIDEAGFTGLASGGHYLGVTYMPAGAVHVRLGVSQWNDKVDRLAFDPGIGLPLAYDNARSQSVLAGVSWDVTDWADFGLSAVHNSQRGLSAFTNLVPQDTITTDALGMAAHFKFGNGWVTTASYSQGLSQLDQLAQAPTLATHSYSIAIAKHGLFGDDALGFSFSRPAPGVSGNGFSAVTASGDLPPMFVSNADQFSNPGHETDLQLGYVTSFLDGALALQADAAYQMNYQGQTGANSVSLLSRAKIKF